MRFSLAVAVVLAGVSVSGLAQQNNTFKVSPSHTTAQKKSAPIGKTTASPVATSTAASRELQSVEHQTAKSATLSRSAGQRSGGKSPALKPARNKPNPPINFAGTGGGNRTKTTTQGSNPYKGRLKQSHGH